MDTLEICILVALERQCRDTVDFVVRVQVVVTSSDAVCSGATRTNAQPDCPTFSKTVYYTDLSRTRTTRIIWDTLSFFKPPIFLSLPFRLSWARGTFSMRSLGLRTRSEDLLYAVATMHYAPSANSLR
eukprot:scaffold243033_cov15-Prasinocladus_malaysianus.AAC.2